MPIEVRGLVQAALGTVRHLKYEVYDTRKSSLTLSSCTYRIYDADGNQVYSGIGTVDNADTDAAGNIIKTVQMNIDFGETDFAVGHYVLVFTFVLSTGESDKGRVGLELKDYEG